MTGDTGGNEPPRYVVRLARPDEAEQICAVCAEGFTASSEGLLSPATIRRQVDAYYTPDVSDRRS